MTNPEQSAEDAAEQHTQHTEDAPVMTTVEHAELLLEQDKKIRSNIDEGKSLDEAIDPSNKEFGPLAHP